VAQLGPLPSGLGVFVRATSAGCANRGMEHWYACTVDGNFRIVQAAPGSPRVRQQKRQTARPATRRAIGSRQASPAARGPSLWPSPLDSPASLRRRRGRAAHRATIGRSPWVAVGVVGCGSVTPKAWPAFIGGSVVGCARPRTRCGPSASETGLTRAARSGLRPRRRRRGRLRGRGLLFWGSRPVGL
jgi:hypothetical protein